jgi:hypothetical protein
MNYSTEELLQFDIELTKGAILGTLTEQRYTELLDILLPTVTDPEAQTNLMGCGSGEWRKRYVEHNRKQTTAA